MLCWCAGAVRRKTAGSSRCCGTQAYNAQSHVCCRGTIQPRPSGSPACCGTRAYDSQECLCCSGTVRFKPPGRPRCCGTEAYNAQSKICCGRTVQSSLQDCSGPSPTLNFNTTCAAVVYYGASQQVFPGVVGHTPTITTGSPALVVIWNESHLAVLPIR